MIFIILLFIVTVIVTIIVGFAAPHVTIPTIITTPTTLTNIYKLDMRQLYGADDPDFTRPLSGRFIDKAP